ncbi:histone-lysine N-methyltransferase ASHH3-like isoform X2 [Miscanthus floridulus]|uniref:histone-lysine N-methyltransferase ASHH3-like isoform X2 n=1 Tax=Miscanthus floridulus TaxID=154761 RepID=UPI0034599CB0
MVRVGSSSSAPGVNLIEQIENVFEQLISKIEPADFDPRPFLKQLNVLGRYKPIKRNVYCTKRRVEDYGISCRCKPSPGSSVVCGRDCHCGMLFSCCSSQCECDNACTNKSFQHRPLKKTKLIKTEKCGHGLVAEDEIKKREFVIEYVGEVIDDRTCENRLWTMKRLNDTNFYLCEVSSNMVIDATNKGNLSRFINHSCEPNTKMQKWTVDGETRVGIFALRDIKIGEELTYDYKFVQFGAAQVCHCGSSNCRKMLGTTKYSGSSQNHHAKKKKRKTNCENCIQQFLRLWHPQQKMYVGCWIVDFDQETKMHTLQFIDLHTEKFDLKEEEWHFLEGIHGKAVLVVCLLHHVCSYSRY